MTVIEVDIHNTSDVLLAIEEIQSQVLEKLGEEEPVHDFLGEVLEILETQYGGRDH